jgi:diguanylate cyclase (GGDEF)-like protein
MTVATQLGAWSIGVQFAVVCLLAVFFAVLARSIRLVEVRLWAAAWVADCFAIGAVGLAAFTLPSAPTFAIRIALIVYAAGKTAYVFLLVAGARDHLRPGTEPPLSVRRLVLLVAGWSLALGVFVPRLALAQLGQSFMVGAMLTAGAIWILRNPRFSRSRWLGWAFLVQGVLFLHYVPVFVPFIWGGSPVVGYASISSFFDAGAELLVALASLVALESSTSERLHHLNEELVASQDRLRQLVDLDPLTNLANRRSLRDHLARVRPLGAALIFIDLDGFKAINDRHGHIVGDACLRRVARQLTREFRAEDSTFRWGGDEFLVIAPGLDADGAGRRVAALRQALATPESEGPACTISVGVAILEPGGEIEAVLHEADERMYADKRRPDTGRGSGSTRLSGIWTRA